MPVFTLNTNPHIDTTGSSPSGTYNVWDTITLEADADRWYTVEGFEIAGNGASYIEHNIPATLVMPSYDISATPLSALVEYNISYNDVDDPTLNPDYYNTETPTFTLNNPTKSGYIFIWWTGTNGSTPELTVIIPQWSFWDRVYYANRQIIPPTPTWWWIMIDGQPLSKRYINWQEVQKIMVNGNQVRPI